MHKRGQRKQHLWPEQVHRSASAQVGALAGWPAQRGRGSGSAPDSSRIMYTAPSDASHGSLGLQGGRQAHARVTATPWPYSRRPQLKREGTDAGAAAEEQEAPAPAPAACLVCTAAYLGSPLTHTHTHCAL